MKAFDRKFGREFMEAVPAQPGIYLVYNEAGLLIYVGKAKNLRRRLAQYRNAKRRKKHHKMRQVVAEAARIEFQLCGTDLDACLLETQTIQKHRPKLNVAGAFYFLYPMIGLKWEAGTAYFAYSTKPELLDGYELHGAYRSRFITGEAFFSLMKLLTFIGHPVPMNKLFGANWKKGRPQHVYLFGFRQLPEAWFRKWSSFLQGETRDAMEDLVLALCENAGARKKQKLIQEYLNEIARFWRHEALPLAKARRKTGFSGYPVTQMERDILFLKYRNSRVPVTSKAAPLPTQT